MRLVGSRLGDPVDHAVRGAAIFGGIGRALYFELLHALHAHAVHSRVVAALAVGFGAIQLFALAVEQASADARVAGRPDHPRRQDDERQVASYAATGDKQRQIPDSLRRDYLSQIAALCFQKRGCRADINNLIDSANGQFHIHVDDGRYIHSHAGSFGLSKAGLLGGHRVVAYRQVGDSVDAITACFDSLGQAGIYILYCHCSLGHGGA